MDFGVIPVIGYLLSRPKRAEKRLRSLSNPRYSNDKQRLLSSEEMELLNNCTGRPQLAAKQVTERLVKDRYRQRISGKQTVEDSMWECTMYSSFVCRKAYTFS